MENITVRSVPHLEGSAAESDLSCWVWNLTNYIPSSSLRSQTNFKKKSHICKYSSIYLARASVKNHIKPVKMEKLRTWSTRHGWPCSRACSRWAFRSPSRRPDAARRWRRQIPWGRSCSCREQCRHARSKGISIEIRANHNDSPNTDQRCTTPHAVPERVQSTRRGLWVRPPPLPGADWWHGRCSHRS